MKAQITSTLSAAISFKYVWLFSELHDKKSLYTDW